MRRIPKWLVIAAALIGLLFAWRAWRTAYPFAFALRASLAEGRVRPQLVIDGRTAVLLAPDGTLWAWGHDAQFSGGATEIPVRIGSDADWAEIAGSLNYMLARKTDGSLWASGWAWTTNTGAVHFGQSGAFSRIGRETDWAGVAARHGALIALKSSGSAWGWGSCGKSGQSFNPTPTQIGIQGDVVAIAADTIQRYVRRADRTIWQWRPTPAGAIAPAAMPQQLGTNSDWARFSAGEFHLLALKTDGSLWATGANLGVVAYADSRNKKGIMIQIGSDQDWAEVYSGENCYLARKRDGTWWGAGENLDGRLGFAPHGRLWGIAAPEKLPFTFEPWALSLGGQTTVMFAHDGSLWTWGKQLGAPVPNPHLKAAKNTVNNWARQLSGHPKPFPDPAARWSHRPRKIWQWKPDTRSAEAGIRP